MIVEHSKKILAEQSTQKTRNRVVLNCSQVCDMFKQKRLIQYEKWSHRPNVPHVHHVSEGSLRMTTVRWPVMTSSETTAPQDDQNHP
uniref:Uncharacterized protein n=1 Tax=Ascaris lumbricoides TaxID=6252 RepID=A0A0M3HQR0_ASCLU